MNLNQELIINRDTFFHCQLWLHPLDTATSSEILQHHVRSLFTPEDSAKACFQIHERCILFPPKPPKFRDSTLFEFQMDLVTIPEKGTVLIMKLDGQLYLVDHKRIVGMSRATKGDAKRPSSALIKLPAGIILRFWLGSDSADPMAQLNQAIGMMRQYLKFDPESKTMRKSIYSRSRPYLMADFVDNLVKRLPQSEFERCMHIGESFGLSDDVRNQELEQILPLQQLSQFLRSISTQLCTAAFVECFALLFPFYSVSEETLTIHQEIPAFRSWEYFLTQNQTALISKQTAKLQVAAIHHFKQAIESSTRKFFMIEVIQHQLKRLDQLQTLLIAQTFPSTIRSNRVSSDEPCIHILQMIQSRRKELRGLLLDLDCLPNRAEFMILDGNH